MWPLNPSHYNEKDYVHDVKEDKGEWHHEESCPIYRTGRKSVNNIDFCVPTSFMFFCISTVDSRHSEYLDAANIFHNISPLNKTEVHFRYNEPLYKMNKVLLLVFTISRADCLIYINESLVTVST